MAKYIEIIGSRQGVKAVRGMVWIFSGIAQWLMHLKLCYFGETIPSSA